MRIPRVLHRLWNDYFGLVVTGFCLLIITAGVLVAKSEPPPIPRNHSLVESIAVAWVNHSSSTLGSVSVLISVDFPSNVRLSSWQVTLGSARLGPGWTSTAFGSVGSITVLAACGGVPGCQINWTNAAAFIEIHLTDGARLTAADVWAFPSSHGTCSCIEIRP